MMEGQLAVPFHFAVEFLVLVVVVGAALESLRTRRQGAGAWALFQALGFAALATAQAAHGALVVAADGDPIVLGIRTGGFALLALFAQPATAVLRRATAAATVSLPAIFLPGVQARWAYVPAGAAIAVAFKGIHAHRRDQDPTTFAFAGTFLAFAGAEVATALAPAGGGTALSIAHGLRVVGALFLARWLWTSVVRSVRTRFVASFVVVLSILVIVIAGALNVVIASTLQDEEIKRLEQAAAGRAETILDFGRSGSGSAGTYAQSAPLATAVAAGRRADVQAFSKVLLEFLPADADFILVVDARGRVMGSAQTVGEGSRPLSDVQAIRIAGSPVVAEALDGRASASPQAVTFPSAGGNVVSQVLSLGAAPIRRGPSLVGAVIVGYRIDRPYLLEVQQDTGADATLIVGTRVSATTLGPASDVEDSLRGLQLSLRIAREDKVPAEGTLSFGGASYVTSFVPVLAEDQQVTGLLALSRSSEALADAQQDIARTLFLITLAAMTAAAALAWLMGGRVTKPIRSLTTAVRELRGGHLEARARVTSGDEVGTLGNAFNDMAQELQRTTGALRTTAAQEAAVRARMEAILQSMSDGVVAADRDGKVVTCNRAAAEMIGRKPEWTAGRRIDEVLDGVAQNGRPLAGLALGGGSGHGSLRRAKGSPLPVALTSAPLRDADGSVGGRVVVVRDISVEQQAERMKSEFLSNVSHELRTPITPIKGYAEIMRRKKFPRDKAEQFLDGILASTSRLERIVEILVDFAAIEAGRLKPKNEAIPVRGLMDDVAARWRGRDQVHRFIRKGGEGLVVLGDPKLLARSLDELMDNAVKFSPEGGQIEIFAEPGRNGSRARKAQRVRITVRDHGIGIEPNQMPDLFQDFRQLDGSETRTFGGLGLGLAYVKRIAGVHGGEIEVDSRPGEGSAFTLVLPAADASSERSGARKPATAARARPTKATPRSPSRSAGTTKTTGRKKAKRR